MSDGLISLVSDTFPLVGRVERFRLSNGLTVLFLPDASVPAVSVQTWFRVGSRDERPGQTGLAHLFEHLSFKATTNYPEGVFSRVLEQAGARDVNAWTWNDQTVYLQTVPSTALDLLFRLESDRMVNLALTQSMLDSEREVVLNERVLTTEDDPIGRIAEALSSTAYTTHPYRWPVIGWRPDIEGMTLDACTDFYRRNYAPNNAFLVIVGDVARDVLMGQLETWYGPISSQPISVPEYADEPPQTQARRVALALQLEDPILSLAYKVPGLNHPDRAALALLELLLFQGRTGLLYRALVAAGIATSADGMVPALSSTSLFEITVGIRQGHTLAEAEAIVYQVLDGLRRDGISADELERIQRRFEIESYTELRDFTGRASFVGAWELATGDFVHGIRHLDAVKAVTSADLQAVLERWMRPEQATVILASPLNADASLTQPDADEADQGDAELEDAELEDPDLDEAELEDPDLDDSDPGDADPSEPPVLSAFSQIDDVASRPELTIPMLAPEALQPPWQAVKVSLPAAGTLLVVEEHSLPLVHLQLLIPGGMALERPGEEGLAAFMAELAQRGTRRRSRAAFEDRVEGLGATLDVVAEVDHLLVVASGLSRDVETLLELLQEALTEPAFLLTELELLRGETLAALREARNDDQRLMDTWFTRLLFSDHPYGRSSLGSARSVAGFTADAVWDAWRRMVRNGSVLAGAAGDITPARAEAGFIRLLQALPEGGQPQATVPLPAFSQSGVLTLIDKPERTQHQLMLGQRSLAASDPRSALLKLANFAFGGPISTSRLMLEVREKRGWSYGVSSRFDSYRVGGCFSTWVFPAVQVSLPCLTLVRELIQTLQQEGLSATELEFARKALLNGAAFEEDTPERLLRNLLIRTWHKRDRGALLKTLATATLDQVNAAVRQVLSPDDLMGVMVCTAADVLPALEASGLFRAIRVLPYDAEELPLELDQAAAGGSRSARL